jgi:hypothetical protein
MKNKVLLLLPFLLVQVLLTLAQQPFSEGTIKYTVVFETKDKQTFEGTYVFTFKNGLIRKDLKLSNGFEDVLLFNTNDNTVYLLKSKNVANYAIQLSMEEMSSRQDKYKGYKLKEVKNSDKEIAGMKACKGELTYRNGIHTIVYYNNSWYPDKTISYERFPDARFLPLEYTFIDEVKGFTMHMVAESVSQSPVENSVFRVPADFKMISNEEYKQISQK